MAAEPSEGWVLLSNNLTLREPRFLRGLENIMFQPPLSLLCLSSMKMRRWFSRETVSQIRCSVIELPLSHRAVEEDCSTGLHMERLQVGDTSTGVAKCSNSCKNTD